MKTKHQLSILLIIVSIIKVTYTLPFSTTSAIIYIVFISLIYYINYNTIVHTLMFTSFILHIKYTQNSMFIQIISLHGYVISHKLPNHTFISILTSKSHKNYPTHTSLTRLFT